jgi:hypothetical protein
VNTPFAQTVIALWIPVTFYLFRRYPVPRATAYSFFAGLLTLPNWAALKPPAFIAIDKDLVITLACVLAILFLRPPGVGRVEPWWKVATFGLLGSSLTTALLNGDPIVFRSGMVIPGHGFKDAAFLVLATVLSPALASYLGLVAFRNFADLRTLARTAAISGLVLVLPIMYEVRFSPQLHRMIYGYAGPHEWGQLIRYGGYRPLVLFQHGLVLSLFVLFCTVIVTAMARTEPRARLWKLTTDQAMWLMIFIVVICKSTGVWVYALVTLPLLRWAPAKWSLRLSVALLVITYVYPLLRAEHVLPLDSLLKHANSEFGQDRSESLAFRFANEEILLDRALLRRWFGWGSYGRNRVYDADGVDICVTDGMWILSLGGIGYVGVFFRYLYTAGAMLIAASRIGKIQNQGQRELLIGVLLASTLVWFDTLPNAPDYPIPEFMGAALCSASAWVLQNQSKARAAARAGRAPLPAARAAAAES